MLAGTTTPMPDRLNDRIAIVTGACAGIGFAIGEALAKSGAIVICADVDESAAQRLPQGVEFLCCDTSHEDACQRVVETTIERFGGIDILINNAAIQPTESYHPLHELPGEVWHRLVGVNLSGYMYMAKYALGQMVKQRSGVIVNIASAQGHRTARQVGVYGPIKSANIMQARQWAIEYARDGIRVVSVSPGAIYTDLMRANLDAQGGGEAIAGLARERVPEEVAAAYGVTHQFGEEYIIPAPFDPRLMEVVSSAVARAAMESGVAQAPIADFDEYQHRLKARLNPTTAALTLPGCLQMTLTRPLITKSCDSVFSLRGC